MRNRGVRRRRAKRNYIDFPEFDGHRPQFEPPPAHVHEFRAPNPPQALSAPPAPD